MLQRKLRVAEDLFRSFTRRYRGPDQVLSRLVQQDCGWLDLKQYISSSYDQPAEAIKEIFALEHVPQLVKDIPASQETFPIEISSYPAVQGGFPLEWSKGDSFDRNWRREFNSLTWLKPMLKAGNFATATNVVHQHCSDLLAGRIPSDMSWDEHILADRTNSLLYYFRYAFRYEQQLVNKTSLAALRVVFLQVLLMADERFYSPGHNHGFMEDLSLIDSAKDMPGFAYSSVVAELAESRILDRQLSKSLAADGAHKENSPEYHLHFIKLANKVLAHPQVSPKTKASVDEIKNRSLQSLLFFIQPDFSLAPFGDTSRFDVRKRLKKVNEKTGISSDSRLESVYRSIIAGDSPAENLKTDKVFSSVGYASLRTSWLFGEDESLQAENSCVFVKCGYKSTIHKHDDDTSYQFFGLGQELIVDPGKFSNDRSQPEGRAGAKSSGHSVFRFQGDFASNRKLRANILDQYVLSKGLSVLTCRSHSDESEKRPTHYRVFIYSKPHSLLIFDVYWTSRRGPVGLSQIPFHPNLKHFSPQDDRSGFYMRREDGRGIGLRLMRVANVNNPSLDVSDIEWHREKFFPEARRSQNMDVASIRHYSERGVNVIAYHVRLLKSPWEVMEKAQDLEAEFENGMLKLAVNRQDVSIQVLRPRRD